MILSENTEVEKYDIFHVDFCPHENTEVEKYDIFHVDFHVDLRNLHS